MKTEAIVSVMFLILSMLFFGVEPASADCTPGPNKVAFYQDPNFQGACVVLGVGRYATPREFGLKNDSISSVKLGPGAWAISYYDAYFKNFTYRHEQSEGSFPKIELNIGLSAQYYNHNDKTSSLEVMKISAAAPGPTPIATYLGQHPTDRSNGWSNKLQGVGHDQNSWFFTQAKYLWKFPVAFDLNRFVKSPLPNGVKKAPIPKELKRLGYNHLGDLVHHKGYLLIPLEASRLMKNGVVIDNSNQPLLAVYRAQDLSFVGSTRLLKQVRAGWLAINPLDDRLYTSENKLNNLNRLISYQIDIAALDRAEVEESLEFINMKPLYDEDGLAITLKPYMQGGEFSDDGKYLFLVNGNQSGETSPRDGGIWIFHFKSGKKVLKSTGSMPFRFEYHPGFPQLQEPEGITYWNLDEGDAPKIKGNLHVILFNRDVTSNDSFWFKHYRIGDIAYGGLDKNLAVAIIIAIF